MVLLFFFFGLCHVSTHDVTLTRSVEIFRCRMDLFVFFSFLFFGGGGQLGVGSTTVLIVELGQ